MKTPASGSCTIAWFKIADFVTRGEKERALTIHKLLMHSVCDQAIAHQLEGDILWSFHDSNFIIQYKIAANLYQQLGQYRQAISLYQKIVQEQPDLETYEFLLHAYAGIGAFVAMQKTVHDMFQLALKKSKIDIFENSMIRCDQAYTGMAQITCKIGQVKSMITNNSNPHEIEPVIAQMLELIISQSSIPQQTLQQAIVDICALDDSWTIFIQEKLKV